MSAAEEIVVAVDDDEPKAVLNMESTLAETDWSSWRIERPTIFRVHRQLRDIDKEAYEPEMISFGPYHCNTERLASMEKLKWLYLKNFLARNPDVRLKDYFLKVKSLEQRARSSYSENVEMESDAFVEMMLLDGCFILELFLARYGEGDEKDDNGGGDNDGSGGGDGDDNDGSGGGDDNDGSGGRGSDDNGDAGSSDNGTVDDNGDHNGGGGGDDDNDDIIEQFTDVQEFEDPIKNCGWVTPTIARDMLMLDNQLPFFLLETLLNLNSPNAELYKLAVQWLTDFFEYLIRPNYEQSENDCASKPYHILHLFYTMVTEPKPAGSSRENSSERQKSNGSNQAEGTVIQITETMGNPKSIVDAHGNYSENSKYMFCLPTEFLCRTITKLKTPSCLEGKVCKTISITNLLCCYATRKGSRLDNRMMSVTKLQDAGVKFTRKEDPKSILDIIFQGNVLEIPQLRVYDRTNCILRNLIAFEQCCQGIGNGNIAHYADFIDHLIDKSEDVEIMQHKEIFENNIGNKEDIAVLCNKICKGVILNSEESYLFNTIKEVNKFCNKWRAKLNRDYFGNPWAIISFTAAVFLLILTVVQAVFAPLSYFSPRT